MRSRKTKSKLYADERRRAFYSKVAVTDTVLVQQEKVNKFTLPFKATPHKVVSEIGNRLSAESLTGARYIRNMTCVKRYRISDTCETLTEQDGTLGAENSTGCETQPTVTQAPDQGITVPPDIQ